MRAGLSMQAAAALSGRWAGAAARLNATAGGAAHFARDAGVARHDQVELGLWPCTRQAAEERGVMVAGAVLYVFFDISGAA